MDRYGGLKKPASARIVQFLIGDNDLGFVWSKLISQCNLRSCLHRPGSLLWIPDVSGLWSPYLIPRLTSGPREIAKDSCGESFAPGLSMLSKSLGKRPGMSTDENGWARVLCRHFRLRLLFLLLHYDILRHFTTYIHELCKAVLWLLSRGAVEIGMRSGTSSVLQQMSTWPFLATWYAIFWIPAQRILLEAIFKGLQAVTSCKNHLWTWGWVEGKSKGLKHSCFLSWHHQAHSESMVAGKKKMWSCHRVATELPWDTVQRVRRVQRVQHVQQPSVINLWQQSKSVCRKIRKQNQMMLWVLRCWVPRLDKKRLSWQQPKAPLTRRRQDTCQSSLNGSKFVEID